ncbi:MAG TPA: SpoIID/LytB domain-containing protein [Symbiobacteriaceae bacterium]|nr:SpoIID/LytB domain-containing protein [Symbiobacteriaceae bacterium]
MGNRLHRALGALLVTLSVLLATVAPALAATVTVSAIRVGQYTDYTRIVIEASGTTTYAQSTADDPYRIIIDVSNATLGSITSPIDVDDGTVRQVRWSQFSPTVVRVVIELEVAMPYTHSTLSGPFRILVDVTKQKSTQPAPAIRVGLLWQQSEVAFGGTGAFNIVNLATGGLIATGTANTTWKVKAETTGYGVYNPSGTKVGTFTGPIRVKLQTPASYRLTAKGLQYRGEFEVKKNVANQVALINEVDTESYLYGVVPKEMSSTWNLNALRAQAMAARTYARANMGRRAADGCDVYDSTEDQVYGGATGEAASTTTAVNDTRGTVMIYGGALINALFHSTAGGYTENNENVFDQAAMPYLRGVATTWESASPVYNWTATVTNTDMQTKLNANPETAVGTLQAITPHDKGVSGRWLWVDITGSQGTKTVRADTFRKAVGAGTVKSTLFTLTRSGTDWAFTGKGYGHGVGMPQYSAKGMGDAGYAFRKILRTFYTDGIRFQVQY